MTRGGRKHAVDVRAFLGSWDGDEEEGWSGNASVDLGS
jgi:hypothetical protein